jgi:hypothetical protein
MIMDNNNPYIQSIYVTSGVNYSSSTAAGQAEAARGGYCAPQQSNETYDAYQNRTQAFNNATQSSGR